MAWECQTCCIESYVPKINTVGTQAWANMGYVGFVQLESALLSQALGQGVLGQTLRVTDFGVGLSQDVDKPDVIDGRIDRTVYRLGPKLVEGSMSMPVIVDTFERDTCPTQEDLAGLGEDSSAGRLLLMLWCWATTRNPEGRMGYDDVDLNVRYANHAAFKYNRAMVNEFTFRCAQGDMITLDVSVIARARAALNAGPEVAASTQGLPAMTDYLSPARVLTWNDVSITGITGCEGIDPGSVLFFSNVIRSWDLTIANNLDRFYTFTGSLFPVDINAGVRDVTGTIEIMGLSENLRQLTSGNGNITGLQSHFTEKNELRFAFYIGNDTYSGADQFTQRDWTGTNPVGLPIFYRRLRAVIFEIEEMSLTNDLYTTSVNYHCLAIDDDGLYEFVSPATSYFPAWYTIQKRKNLIFIGFFEKQLIR